jgi:hypothetical protein
MAGARQKLLTFTTKLFIGKIIATDMPLDSGI